jgi:hypothetical protein
MGLIPLSTGMVFAVVLVSGDSPPDRGAAGRRSHAKGFARHASARSSGAARCLRECGTRSGALGTVTTPRWFTAVLCALLPGEVAAASGRPTAGDPGAPEPCIESWGEVRPRAGRYDHFVLLSSRCSEPARCAVSSDSNPAPRHVVVDPWHTLEVLVARGSPAPRFVPGVTCRYRPNAHPE